MSSERMTLTPLVGTAGLACAYLTPQAYVGDNAYHQLLVNSPASYGNESLFSVVENGFGLTHRAIVTVDLHAKCSFVVAVERTLAIQLDKGASGGLMSRGQSFFLHGEGNSFYQGILEAGMIVRAAVSAPGDEVEILDGYFSIVAFSFHSSLVILASLSSICSQLFSFKLLLDADLGVFVLVLGNVADYG